MLKGPVKLNFENSLKQETLVTETVEGTSLHDAVVRYAWRVYDSLRITTMYTCVDPATGKTFQRVHCDKAMEIETTVNVNGKEEIMQVWCSGGSVESHHYTELPWSPELWQQLYDECGMGLSAYYWSSCFSPHPGELRDGLIREASLAYVSGRGKLEPVTADIKPVAGQITHATPVPQPKGPADSSTPARMTPEQADARAKELVTAKAEEFLSANPTKQAAMIGCDLRTWKKAHSFDLYAKKRRRNKTKGHVPLAVGSTDTINTLASIGGKDEMLQHLISQHQDDNEPSPLEDTPRRVYQRKKV